MDELILDAPEEQENELFYASFGERFVASLIDGILTTILSYGLIGIGYVTGSDFIIGIFTIIGSIASFLYFPLLTSSEKQATIGKQAMGMVVVDMEGRRISFLNAVGRYLGKILSALTLFIGYIMAAFTEKSQALHDIMAGTLVVKK